MLKAADEHWPAQNPGIAIGDPPSFARQCMKHEMAALHIFTSHYERLRFATKIFPSSTLPKIASVV